LGQKVEQEARTICPGFSIPLETLMQARPSRGKGQCLSETPLTGEQVKREMEELLQEFQRAALASSTDLPPPGSDN
jgi:hypothetical protein